MNAFLKVGLPILKLYICFCIDCICICADFNKATQQGLPYKADKMTILEPGDQRARRNNGAFIGTNKNINIAKDTTDPRVELWLPK